MYIKKLSIKNFKSLQSAQFYLNQDINILTGVNNSGKTTVLEALALWEQCFRLLIYQAKIANKKKNIVSGQHALHKSGYIASDDVYATRSREHGDIFYNEDITSKIELECVFHDGRERGKEIVIGFNVAKADGWNYRIDHKQNESFDFKLFNEFFSKFPMVFAINHASPIAAILPYEEFASRPKIRASLRRRNSISVLRNRIYLLYRNSIDPHSFEQFQQSVSYVLTGLRDELTIKTESDVQQHVQVEILVKLNRRDKWKELSLVGSGTLQIIEVLLGVFDKGDGSSTRSDLDILLLDEPDSHIHRDIQRRLLDVLRQHTASRQVFLSTQNESLIRCARPSWLFHLEPNTSREYHPITSRQQGQVTFGLQPSQQIKILRALGSESALDFLNALEAQKLLLVEGEDDARYIQLILDRKYMNATPPQVMYWSFRGVAAIFENIDTYRVIFSQFKNEKTLWEKAVLLFDRDDFTTTQRNTLILALEKKLKIPIYIWNAYTIESTLLTEIDKFELLLWELMRKEGQYIEPNDLHNTLSFVLNEFARQCADRLNDTNVLRGVFERIKDKREKLQNRLSISNVLPSDPIIQGEYLSEARTALTNRKLEYFASKDDIIQLVKQVYGDLDLPFEEHDLFGRLFAAAGVGSAWYQEWDEICQRALS